MSGPGKVINGPVNNQQQPLIVNNQPQVADRKVEVTTKIKELNSLIRGSNEETKTLAILLTVNHVLPHVVPGNSPASSLTNLATIILNNSSEAEKQAAARTLHAHFHSQFQAINQAALLSSFKGENKENKLPPRIDIEFSRNILIDLQQEIETLVSITAGFTDAVQKEIGRFELTNQLREKNYDLDIVKGCVTAHYKKHVELHNTAVDHLQSIGDKKERIEFIRIILNKCIEDFMLLNKEDSDKIKFIFEEIHNNIRSAYELGKYNRENWYQHSQSFPLPDVAKPFVSDMHFKETSIYQFLDENLDYYEHINKFTEEATSFGKEVLWMKHTKTNNPFPKEAEEKAKAFPEIYHDLSTRSTDINDKLEEHNKKLALVKEFISKNLSEQLKGLEEQENTIMQQSNSLLAECNNVDKAVNETATQDYSPITHEKKEKYPA